MDETTKSPQLDIVVPVHDEEAGLEVSVRRLHSYLADELPFTFRITIADNASQDETWSVATSLATELPEVRAVHLAAKGRGRVLHETWSNSDACVLAYMDVDLSTDLTALFPLVAPCCRSSRTGPGSSTPSCSCCANGPGCASTRCPSTRWTTSTAGLPSYVPWSTTCVAWCGSAGS